MWPHSVILVSLFMSQKLLLQKRKEVRDLHLNNPNFTSKPPIGEDSQTFYTPRQCGDRDK